MTLEAVMEEVKSWTLDEQRQLRAQLDAILAASEAEREERFKQVLLQAGLIAEMKPHDVDVKAFHDYIPIQIKGKPLSETIIEERR